MRTTGARLVILALAGVLATVSALALASSVGHSSALFVGAQRAWFDVDFMHPRAAEVALSLQCGFLIIGFGILGRWAVRTNPPRFVELVAAANPVTCLLGFLLYRMIKPFDPGVVYLSALSALLVGLGFPLFLAAAWLGSKVWREASRGAV